MSSVNPPPGSLELVMTIYDGVSTPEDFYYRDALKWQFKPIAGAAPQDFPYLYCIDGRLYANAATFQPQPDDEDTLSLRNPLINGLLDHSMSVKLSVARIAPTFGLPFQQTTVGFVDSAWVGVYFIPVNLGSQGTFNLQVDTGSAISWVYGFSRGQGDNTYDIAGTQIPESRFTARYIDGGEISGVVCMEVAQVDGKFSFPWAFGVGLEAKGSVAEHRLSDGVLALSCDHPSAQRHGIFESLNNAESFVEYLMREQLIRPGDPTFCIKIRRRTPSYISAEEYGKGCSTIIFGELPHLGDNRTFRFQPTIGRRWALASSRIEFKRSNEPSARTIHYPRQHGFQNAAVLDTGAAYIYLDGSIVEELYAELCGTGGFVLGEHAYYIKDEGRRRLKDSTIIFCLGEYKVAMPAWMLVGEYSDIQRASFGTIQSKGSTSTLEEDGWTFDILGAAFFKYAWVAFNANMVHPAIAICGTTVEEQDEGKQRYMS